MMRQVQGHSNRKKPRVDQFWDHELPLDWPWKTVWTLKEDDMWPMGKTLKGSARSPAATATYHRVWVEVLHEGGLHE